MASAPSEDSDQPGHPPILIGIFAVRLKKAWVLSYPLSIHPGWSESSLGAHAILLVLSRCGSFLIDIRKQHVYGRTAISSNTKTNWATPWENVSYAICEQQRHRSACASAQSDLHLCCSLPRQHGTSGLYLQNFRILAGLSVCVLPGRRHPVAHFVMTRLNYFSASSNY